MHARNKFKDYPPDFGAYSITHPPLKPHLIQRPRPSSKGFSYTLNFSDPDALRELARACLKHEFQLNIDIIPGHLVPAIPQRLNYIHWLEDLINEGGTKSQDSVTGIDIGTGSSCIFPLLGARLNKWQFVATEVETTSIECAQQNVKQNNLEDFIQVCKVSQDDILVGVVDSASHYHFCMCNPPFYKDQEDKLGTASRSGHRPVPHTQNTGNRCETITEGGEVGFIKRIVEDSIQLKTQIKWYTSMIGKKSTVKTIKQLLSSYKVPVVMDTEFVQGKTHRWGIAWSHDSHVTKVVTPVKRQRPYTLTISNTLQETLVMMREVCDALEISCEVREERDSLATLSCTATKTTWLHQRKRRRILQRLKGKSSKENDKVTDNADSNNSSKSFSLSTADDIEKKLEEQLESLSSPCNVVFECSVALSESSREEAPPCKKTRDESLPRCDTMCTVSFTSIAGELNHLYQIVQYIQKKLNLR